ncbi:inositol monophosphatase family protein, partial [Salmonella enterica]
YIAAGIYDAFIDLSENGYEKDCDIIAAYLILKEAGGDVYDNKGELINFQEPSINFFTKRRNIIASCNSTIKSMILENLKGECI